MTRRIRPTLLALALVVGACGGESAPAVAPTPVDPALAPAEVPVGERTLRLFENTDGSTVDAFANAGSDSLMADGRLWELRRAERLIGTLQITTLLPEVDLTDEDRRSGIVRGMLAGAVTRIRVGDVEVHTVDLDDRAQYVWFGLEMVQILTVRGSEEVDPEVVLRAVLDHQKTIPAWNPLPAIL